ncbi:type IV secretion protein Rhs [Alkanindiges sp. WGS2144]|uniref:type IV secretion protein Rhs n=1 Tax=Alkanindiges sp. WGS2144 TaxID=3366808 RepID=UPI003750C5AF
MLPEIVRINRRFKASLTRLTSPLLRLRHCRPLTLGEKSLAYSVFHDQLDLNSPRICSSDWILTGYAMSPNGHVYFNPADYLEDFSTASLDKQGWFMHEMTHVWQVQQGMKVIQRALLDRRYRYLLKQGKSFFAYGIEQQAQMVQDFFIKRSLGQDCQALEQCLPFFNSLLDNNNIQ